jgi:hypothetical protein
MMPVVHEPDLKRQLKMLHPATSESPLDKMHFVSVSFDESIA